MHISCKVLRCLSQDLSLICFFSPVELRKELSKLLLLFSVLKCNNKLHFTNLLLRLYEIDLPKY